MYFDTVDLNKKIDTFFIIKNTGKNIYVIDRISPSCTCTDLKFSSNRVNPNESLKVFFSFKPQKKNHYYFSPIMIFGNTKPNYRQFSFECFIK